MTEKKEEKKDNKKYTYATGRRKSAIAKVRIYDEKAGKSEIIINNKDCKSYFSNNNILLEKIYSPLKLLHFEDKFYVSVKVFGGGPNGQAEAIRLGISRVLLKMNEDFKKELKAYNYLTRDPRKVERKKPGLKKARRAPQWKKR
ncbi:MAG: 30S ribosomal protein S9 [Xanthomonadaceae bacterium]|nr:30S ribosomal protein S9 [Rhodospirillaceae bacterium]NIA18177.1 30S ribosomal protein S9 [Xanthomonadaceae bacterium]